MKKCSNQAFFLQVFCLFSNLLDGERKIDFISSLYWTPGLILRKNVSAMNCEECQTLWIYSGSCSSVLNAAVKKYTHLPDNLSAL